MDSSLSPFKIFSKYKILLHKLFHLLEIYFQYKFLHGFPLHAYKFFFNHGICPYTRALCYISRGFHLSSHTEKIQQTSYSEKFYKVFTHKISQRLGGILLNSNLIGLKNSLKTKKIYCLRQHARAQL
jgi:hypothetical protein